MHKTRFLILAVVFGMARMAAAAPKPPMPVLVTNDDGVGAPGIDALVNALVANPNLQVMVIAPANNSSGTGEQTTTATPIQVTSSMTASGYPAKAVNGFPGDAALWGIEQELAATPPALVVSGINNGQNLSAEVIPFSGTVGAATWAARLGVPAFAVSAGLGTTPNYADAAAFTAKLVEKFRKTKGFQKKMKEKEAPFRGIVLNVNVPTCAGGAVRGVRVVAVGRGTHVSSYTLVSDVAGVQTWQAQTTSTNVLAAADCTSTLTTVATDVEAFTNGFASLTPLVAERGVSGIQLKDFKFAEKLFP